jgi:hypothetical protein
MVDLGVLKKKLDDDFSVYEVKESELSAYLSSVYYRICVNHISSQDFCKIVKAHNLKLLRIDHNDETSLIEITFLVNRSRW